MALTKAQLRPGAVLLLDDSHDLTDSTGAHAMVKGGQRLRGDPQGSADMVHAVVWSKMDAVEIAQEHQTAGGIVFAAAADNMAFAQAVAASDVEPEISEASGRFGVRNHWLRKGRYAVFTLNPDQVGIGRLAARIARTWGSSGLIEYSQSGATASVLNPADMGIGMAARMASEYARQASDRFPAWAKKPSHEQTGGTYEVNGNFGNAFCSQFVVACYQAAAIASGQGLGTIGTLGTVYAPYANARDLHGALRRSQCFQEDEILVQRTPHDGQ